ncbi:MAG: YCF48-related protein [Ignavibacteria bacterium]|nr:YCF48-related protein [Ignavibacteria bacterium]
MIKSFIISLALLHYNISSDWFKINTGISENLYGISPGYSQTGELYIGGDLGRVITSSDGGDTWTDVSPNLPDDIRYISIVNRGGHVTGTNGMILRTGDGGRTWIRLNTNTTATINSKNFTYAVGNGGVILRTTDLGYNWNTINSPVSVDLMSIDSERDIAVGKNGTIIRRIGLNWVVSPSGTTVNLNKFYNVVIGTRRIFFIAGDNGTLLKSENEAGPWTTIPLNTNENIYSIVRVKNSAMLYLCGSNGLIMKSLDTGRTWQPEPSGTNINLRDIAAAGNNLICVGDQGTILLRKISTWDMVSFQGNSVRTNYTNYGLYNRNFFTGNSGFEWPKNSGKYARYCSGLWLGAVVNSDTLIAFAEYSSEFSPGFTDNNGNPQGKNDMKYIMYRLTYGRDDYYRSGWPNALLGNSDQGAPVYFDPLTCSYKPLDMGHNTVFCSFTDSYYEYHVERGGGTRPLKADVKLVAFAIDSTDALNRTIFQQYSIINRSNSPWRNFYAAIWTDDDIGANYRRDLMGCDSALSLYYTYKADNSDSMYNPPPAVGFVLISGLQKFTGNSYDSVNLCINKKVIVKKGYKNSDVSVIRPFKNTSIYSDPMNYRETYRVLRGLLRSGQPIVNPLTGASTAYVYSGDPVNSTGWTDPFPEDLRGLMSVGPVDVNPGDTQYVVFAQVIAQGSSNLNSITKLKETATEVVDFYRNCLPFMNLGNNNYPSFFKLYQNYPNPFNPETKIRFDIPAHCNTSDTKVKLTVYDISGRVVTILVDEVLQPGSHIRTWNGSNHASGVYFYQFIAGSFIQSKKMVLIK